jgi:hypothetical protein
MGNAYYNLGALHALRQVFEDVSLVQDVTSWIWPAAKSPFESLEHIVADVCFLSGPTLTHGIEGRYRRVFDSLVARGGQVAFISAGAYTYTERERDEVLAFLARYPTGIACLATRDARTFELYSGRCPFPVFDGICCSMFLSEAVRVASLASDYVVFNFPLHQEPLIEMSGGGDVTVREHSGRPQDRLNDLPIVRTRSEGFIRDASRVFDRPNMYCGDLPEGFLAVFKSARYVFSERVHTCAATLALGGIAMYVPRTERSRDQRHTLLFRLELDEITKRPMKLSQDVLSREKAALLQFLQSVFS